MDWVAGNAFKKVVLAGHRFARSLSGLEYDRVWFPLQISASERIYTAYKLETLSLFLSGLMSLTICGIPLVMIHLWIVPMLAYICMARFQAYICMTRFQAESCHGHYQRLPRHVRFPHKWELGITCMPQVWWNSVRIHKPQTFRTSPDSLPDSTEDGKNCDFCKWEVLTATDTFGRYFFQFSFCLFTGIKNCLLPHREHHVLASISNTIRSLQPHQCRSGPKTRMPS